MFQIKGSFSGKRGQEKVNPYSKGGVCANCIFILCGPMPPSFIGMEFVEYLNTISFIKLKQQFKRKYNVRQERFCDSRAQFITPKPSKAIAIKFKKFIIVIIKLNTNKLLFALRRVLQTRIQFRKIPKYGYQPMGRDQLQCYQITQRKNTQLQVRTLFFTSIFNLKMSLHLFCQFQASIDII